MKFVILFVACAFILQGQHYIRDNECLPDSYCRELNIYQPIPTVKYEIDMPLEDLEEKRDVQDLYRIKIGDIFRISIYGEDQTTKEVVVSPSGEVTYLFPEPVLAMGKTIFELRDSLEQQLQRHYLNPYLSITPITFAAEYYTIIGEVNQPGTKSIEGNPTLLSALCDARGFTMNTFRDHYVDFSDLDYSFIARKGEYLPVDFNRLVTEGDLSQDVRLKAGDYIYINHRRLYKIYVLGEVRRQQAYDYLTTVTLAEVIADCGGVTLESSSRVAVIRGSLACPTQYYIDINLIFKGCAPDFELQPGDIVYVPPRNFTFLREVYRSAVRTFIGITASNAGNKAFVQMTPDALGVSGPVNVISFGTGTATGGTTTPATGEAVSGQ